MGKKSRILCVIASLLVLGFSAMAHAEGEDLQKQIDAVKAAIPKFAVPMREVGDRFQNMYFAAKGGNWGLAAYMSKYMNAAMNPAKLTKPNEYTDWVNFYSKTFDPVNKAIMAQDFTAFDKEYKAVVKECNACHEGMGYGFIKVVPLKSPTDPGINYKVKSKATDVPK
jgi:predicted aminopeptidase